jgi:PAS domain S-box-containing protein
MTPIRNSQAGFSHATKDDLYWIGIDLAVQGSILGTTIKLVRGRFDDFSITIIACFLAAMFLIRIVFGSLEDFRDHLLGKLIAIVVMVLFSTWLLHEASNVRTGWYRTNVLQDRFSRIVSSAPAYVLLWDADGNITEASVNIHFLTGYRRTELIGQPMTTLLRRVDQPGYLRGMVKATTILKQDNSPDAGWLMQGIITFGLLHKDGRVVPVKAYSGGIRWSQEVQFKGDTDLFAVFVPVDPNKEKDNPATTIDPTTPVKVAPPPPPTKTLVPGEAK